MIDVEKIEEATKSVGHSTHPTCDYRRRLIVISLRNLSESLGLYHSKSSEFNSEFNSAKQSIEKTIKKILELNWPDFEAQEIQIHWPDIFTGKSMEFCTLIKNMCGGEKLIKGRVPSSNEIWDINRKLYRFVKQELKKRRYTYWGAIDYEEVSRVKTVIRYHISQDWECLSSLEASLKIVKDTLFDSSKDYGGIDGADNNRDSFFELKDLKKELENTKLMKVPLSEDDINMLEKKALRFLSKMEGFLIKEISYTKYWSYQEALELLKC